MGFISLLLTALDDPLKKLCFRSSAARADAAAQSPYGQSRCPAGESPFWDSKTLHQTHVFIFILACTHITYACTSVSPGSSTATRGSI